MRLKQNIEDVKTWCGALQLDWKQEWLMSKSLLQTSRSDRPLRIPAIEFYNRFYFMSHLCPDLRQPVNDDEEVLALEDAPAADDDHAPSISGDPEGPGPGHAAPPRPARRVGNRESEQMAMMKEYLIACLKPSAFISTVLPDDNETSLSFVQVLAIAPKVTIVDTCVQRDLEPIQFGISVQEFSPVIPLDDDPMAVIARGCVDVFTFADDQPAEVEFGHWTPGDRSNFKQWTPEASSEDSCVVRLRDPVTLKPNPEWTLMHEKMPTLVLLDALADSGWNPKSGIVEHAPGSDAKEYDSRKPRSKKN